MTAAGIAGALLLGLAFGFTLQRGSFCGSSLLSTVVLHRDAKGMVGILAAISVSMLGFALMAHLGWVIPNPNPMRLLSAVVGGTVFGVGMVLAGGCVTGTLYKAAEGRLTSMLALGGIGLGALVVDKGILASTKKALVVATKTIRPDAGLHDVVGVSYPVAAVVLGALGLAAVGIWAVKNRRPGGVELSMKKLISGGWSPVTAGVVIGGLGWAAYLLSSAAGRNNPLGGLGGVKNAFGWALSGEISGSSWMVFLVLGILAGSALSAALRRGLTLRSADAATLLIALLGGVLVGMGAAVGRGCFIGNNISGLALLSLHSAVFAVFTVVANWVTTILYLRGLR